MFISQATQRSQGPGRDSLSPFGFHNLYFIDMHPVSDFFFRVWVKSEDCTLFRLYVESA